MGKTKHEKSFVDFEHPYERNIIGLRGVIYFGIGLLLLIVITFGLMLFFQNVLLDQAEQDNKNNVNPMAETGKERLPKGSVRLQAAPGFGVETKDGYVNLELMHPQAEWEVVQEMNKDLLENGEKTESGTVTALPIEKAKEKLMEGKSETTSNEQGNELYKDSMMIISESSAGRVPSVRRR